MTRLGALVTAAMLASCADEPAPSRTRTATIDDLAATGYTGWDETLLPPHAAAGEPDPRPFLYADDRSTVRAVANDGTVLREWRVPGFDQVEFAEPTPDGGIVAVSVDQGVVRLDAAGGVAWEFRDHAHHEVAPRPDGGFVVPVWRVHEYGGRRVRFDELVWLSPEGREERRWSSFEHEALLGGHHAPLPLQTLAPATADDGRTYDLFHVNTVVVLTEDRLGLGEPAGALLVCARNASLVFVLDPEGDRVLWSWGPGELDFPHTPTPTARGVLVFDNGFHRGWSRLLEVDPRTDEVVWEWRAEPPTDFFTKRRGSCQRLANGHTFVTESERGRLFELDAGGSVVWSWTNPEERDGRRRRIYRARRVDPSAFQER